MAQRVLTDAECKRWTPAGLLPEAVDPATIGEGFRPFPVEVLPEPMAGFTKAAAAAIGCGDASMIAVPLLAASAGCIGNSAVAELKPGWPEPAVIWGAVVSESGTAKSPALDAVTRPLAELAVDQVRAHEQAMVTHQRDRSIWEADYAEWKRKGRGTGEPPPVEPEEPKCCRTVVSDSTVEALAVLLDDNPRGLLLARDEGAGLLRSFDQYKSGKGSDAQHYLSMHGARPMIVDRKGAAKGSRRTIVVPRAALSIVMGIQPASLQRALGQEHFENGLAARFFMTAPPSRPKRWSDDGLSEGDTKKLAELYRRLLDLQGDENDRGEPVPRVLKLTASGKRAWVSFYNEHADEHAKLQGNLAAAWAKLEGGAARIALVIHLVRSVWFDTSLEDHDAIDATSIDAGVAISRWFAHEAKRIYGMFGESDEERDRRKLVEWLTKRGGKATARELSKASMGYDAEGAELALNDLGKAGFGKWEFVPAGARGGRPTSVFVLSQFIPGQNGRVEGEPGWVRDEAADVRRQLESDSSSKSPDLDDVNRMLADLAGDEL